MDDFQIMKMFSFIEGEIPENLVTDGEIFEFENLLLDAAISKKNLLLPHFTDTLQ